MTSENNNIFEQLAHERESLIYVGESYAGTYIKRMKEIMDKSTLKSSPLSTQTVKDDTKDK